jgi:hypothetical protein
MIPREFVLTRNPVELFESVPISRNGANYFAVVRTVTCVVKYRSSNLSSRGLAAIKLEGTGTELDQPSHLRRAVAATISAASPKSTIKSIPRNSVGVGAGRLKDAIESRAWGAREGRMRVLSDPAGW